MSAIFAVIPRPAAAFSPLTMQKSALELLAQRRAARASTARRPGGAEHVGDEEDAHAGF